MSIGLKVIKGDRFHIYAERAYIYTVDANKMSREFFRYIVWNLLSRGEQWCRHLLRRYTSYAFIVECDGLLLWRGRHMFFPGAIMPLVGYSGRIVWMVCHTVLDNSIAWCSRCNCRTFRIDNWWMGRSDHNWICGNIANAVWSNWWHTRNQLTARRVCIQCRWNFSIINKILL